MCNVTLLDLIHDILRYEFIIQHSRTWLKIKNKNTKTIFCACLMASVDKTVRKNKQRP